MVEEPLYDPTVANSGFAGLLDDPRARAALLQFGIQMMQPNYGQSGMGALGQAIGAGGEAIGRIEEQDRKAAETDRKLADTESKLGKREADISTAQGRLDATSQQNSIRQQRADTEQMLREGRITSMQAKTELDRLRLGEDQIKFGLTQAFRNTDRQNRILLADAKAIENRLIAEAKRETDFKLMGKSGEIFQGDATLAPYKGLKTRTEIEDALSKDPAYMGSVLSRHGTPQTATPMPTQPGRQPISGTMEQSGNITYPVAPQNPSARSVDQIYMTPRGPLQWTGQGWLPPTGT